MKHTKLITTFLFAACCHLTMTAQEVVSRSTDSRPDWVGQIKENYLIASASAYTLEDAQAKCMNIIKVQMLESVAQNIEFSTETTIEQFTHNENVSSDITFRQKGRTSVANLPYISGVSMAKAAGAYWECLRDGTNGKLFYTYNILYPYPDTEYRKLKREFEKLDNAMVESLNKLDKEEATIANIDTLEANMLQLENLENYFFDAIRKADVRRVKEKYRKIYDRLNVESKRTAKCKFRCWITLDGNVMECSTLPKCKSETASKIKVTIDEESYVVTFSDEECISDEDNTIDMTFRLKHTTLKHKLYF